MEKLATCELSFIPIQSEDYIKDVDIVLDIIASYNVEHTIGLLSTTIRANKEVIFEMLQKIYDTMEDKAKFSMVSKIGNVCGIDK